MTAGRVPPVGDHFRWHDAARLFGPDGAELSRHTAFTPLPAGDDAAAIAAVMAGQGRPFRIGGTGPLEAGQGEFEALTGGSLGNARRVLRAQSSWLASFSVNAGLFGIRPGVGVAVLGRPVHSLALYAALEGLHLGAGVHLLEGLRPDRQAAALAGRGAGVVYATPAQLRALCGAGLPLPGLRHVIIGGAKLDGGLRQVVTALCPGARISEFYGAAEASFITLSTGQSGSETVGLPYPGVELRVEPDSGLVWVRSPYLFRCYGGDDPGSARWQDGWLTVGEVGQMTPEGLILKGRAGRMVTVADRNVFPEAIETLLLSLPGVERAAVLPVPDGPRGQVLVAHLMGDAGQDQVIMAALRRALGPMVAPRRLLWRGDWPVLPSGKTDLATLAAEGADAWR